LGKLLKDFGLHSEEDVYVRVGYGRLETRHMIERLAPSLSKALPRLRRTRRKVLPFYKRSSIRQQRMKKSGSLISVDGMDDVLVYYAKCCNPIPAIRLSALSPGTRDNRASVGLSQSFEFDQARRLEVAWNALKPARP